MISSDLSEQIFLIALFVLSLPSSLQAKEHPLVVVNTEMKQAAVSFIATLDKPLRKQATFNFAGTERKDWHFIPKERVGVSFREMTLQQRRAAHQLMRSVLSEKGYFKSVTIMSLEQILRELEADRENVEEVRNSEKYWFAVFGDPSSEKPWAWRVEGHHLSLNFTSVKGKVVATAPIFFGTNPAEVRVGAKTGLRVLGNEEDQARALLAALNSSQRKQAIIAAQVPKDVLTVPGKPVDIGTPEGIAAKDMTAVQQKMLLEMVSSFLHHLRPTLAAKEIATVEKAGIEGVHFAWAGDDDPEKNHYFRLHGPNFILEYDNAQGNHAHLVWHSRDNDFGARVLHEHYKNSPHHNGQK